MASPAVCMRVVLYHRTSAMVVARNFTRTRWFVCHTSTTQRKLLHALPLILLPLRFPLWESDHLIGCVNSMAKFGSWRILVVLVAVCSLIAACSRWLPPQPVEDDPAALFDDRDIEQAASLFASELGMIDGVEGGVVPEGEESALTEPESDIAPQAVLADAGGYIVYVRHDPGSSTPWQVYLADQVTNVRTRIYKGTREIQSVAISLDGNRIVMAMQVTAGSSNFEVYALTRSTGAVTRLTNTSHPETNVSVSASGATIVWEGRSAAGQRAIILRQESGTSFTESALSSTYEQFQPSMSGNGAYVAFIRHVSSEYHVMRYQLQSSAYLTVTKSSNHLEHPSVSNDGNKVAWLEHRSTDDRARVRTISAASTVTAVSSSSGIQHPHLTSDGAFITYGRLRSDSWNIYTKNLSTGKVARTAGSSLPRHEYTPYWQKAAIAAPIISSFTATPSSIDAGGGSTLTWSVTAASSLRIDPEVGTVTGTSVTVSPGSSTTYTLTATNEAGSTTATTTVTVTQLASKPITVAAAGDIACDPGDPSFNGGLGTATNCRMKDVADLMLNMPDLSAVLMLGDSQYHDATIEKFMASYHPTWGRLKDITYPILGDHEYYYHLEDAAGYFAYFGERAGDPTKGYYSYELGEWLVIALNTNCAKVGGCGSTSPQGQWLRQVLANNTKECIMAYMHYPRFSSGKKGGRTAVTSFWRALYAYGADVVVSADDHIYERFAKQDPDGNATESGMRLFVVGTGGKVLYNIATIQPNSEVRNADTYGVLKLDLHPGSYSWEFVPIRGQTFTDAGSATCN